MKKIYILLSFLLINSVSAHEVENIILKIKPVEHYFMFGEGLAWNYELFTEDYSKYKIEISFVLESEKTNKKYDSIINQEFIRDNGYWMIEFLKERDKEKIKFADCFRNNSHLNFSSSSECFLKFKMPMSYCLKGEFSKISLNKKALIGTINKYDNQLEKGEKNPFCSIYIVIKNNVHVKSKNGKTISVDPAKRNYKFINIK